MNKVSILRFYPSRAGRLFFLMLGLMLFGVAGCAGPQALVERLPAGEILFKDDFSDPNSGWDRSSASGGETNYDEGAYRIWVNEPYTDLLSNPHLQFGDVLIEVDATAGGTENNVFGVICRSNPAGDQYYFFVISSDGYYGIGKVDGQEQVLLNAQQLMPSDAIRQKKLTNMLRVECVGERLSFFVNDELLAEVTDSAYTSGDIGLTAGSFDEPDVDVHFDNLVVGKP